MQQVPCPTILNGSFRNGNESPPRLRDHCGVWWALFNPVPGCPLIISKEFSWNVQMAWRDQTRVVIMLMGYHCSWLSPRSFGHLIYHPCTPCLPPPSLSLSVLLQGRPWIFCSVTRSCLLVVWLTVFVIHNQSVFCCCLFSTLCSFSIHVLLRQFFCGGVTRLH